MINQLVTSITNQFSPITYRYLLIDGLATVNGTSPLHVNHLSERLGDSSVSIIPRPEIAYDPLSCPKLILLAKPGQDTPGDLIRLSVGQALSEHLYTKQYICGWITSELPIEELSEQLLAIGTSLASSMDIDPFVPFYEPVRLELLDEANRICGDWLPMLLRSMDCYLYLSMDMQLQIIKKLDYKPNIANLFITEEAKFYQKHTKKILSIYIGWARYCADNKKIVAHTDLLTIATLYRQAMGIGLTNTNDNFVYVLFHMEYGEITKNELIAEQISLSINDPGCLGERFNQLNMNEFLALTNQ